LGWSSIDMMLNCSTEHLVFHSVVSLLIIAS
jgi:hypothetical protein